MEQDSKGHFCKEQIFRGQICRVPIFRERSSKRHNFMVPTCGLPIYETPISKKQCC